MTEQAGPRELITHAVAAEQAGFDFEVSSDHYSRDSTRWAIRRTRG